ncbi:unnamed protein product, partial [Rotaria sp. Silwood1]
HRDIKVENIFLKDKIIKIGDLGVAVARFKVGYDCHQLHKSINGDPICVPPEMHAGKPYDTQVDVFGVGIVLISLILETTRPTYHNQPIGFS